MGMKVAKFHMQMHMQRYCELFGTSRNWNTKPSEVEHKYKLKLPGRQTLKRQHTMSVQAASN